MKSLVFQQVEVFTAVPFKGNPVAIVLDGDGLSNEKCSRSRPGPTYQRRRSSALRRTSGPTTACGSSLPRESCRSSSRLVQECGKGLVDIKIDGERLLLALPEPRFREPTTSDITAIAEALGVTATDIQRAAIIDVGPVWFTVQLASGDAVRSLAPEMGKLAALNSIGITGANVFGLYPESANTNLEVRSFAPGDGVPEDPV